MKVVKPINITDSIFTVSSVAEPDPLRGEVEWEDRKEWEALGLGVNFYARRSITINDSIYTIGGYYDFSGQGVILKTNMNTNASTIIVTHNDALTDGVYDGKTSIYALTISRDVISINLASGAVLSCGSFTGNYYALTLALDLNIYGVGGSNKILKIVCESNSVSEFNITDFDSLNVVEPASNGFLYATGFGRHVVKIDTSTNTATSLGSINTNLSIDSSVIKAGIMYCLGGGFGRFPTTLLEVNTESDTFNLTTPIKGNYHTLDLDESGNVVSIGSGREAGQDVIFSLNLNTTSGVATETIIDSSELGLVGAGSVLGNRALYFDELLNNNAIIRNDNAYKPQDQTILTSTHRKYQCATETRDNPVDGIAKVPPTWIDIGPTNKWALFDEKTTETTKSAGNYTIQLKPTTNTDMIAMMNVSGATQAQITCTSARAGVVYTKTVNLLNIDAITDFYSWFFYELAKEPEFTLLDIPIYSDLTIDIVITGTDLEIGRLVVGRQKSIGKVLAGLSSDRKDYSSVSFDSFGNETNITRPIVRQTTYPVLVEKKLAPALENYLDDIRGEPLFWIGYIGDGQYKNTFGRIERSPMVYNNLSHVEYSIKVRGSI